MKKRLTALVICIGILTALLPFGGAMAQGTAAQGASAAASVPTENYISPDGYKEFGLGAVNQASSQPGDFQEGTPDPLEGYTPMQMSELYVASMNRKTSYKGDADIRKLTAKFSADNIKIDKMYSEGHHTFDSGVKWVTQNAAGIKFENSSSTADIQDGVLEAAIYYEPGKRSGLRLTTYAKGMDKVMDTKDFDLSDKKTSNPDWAKWIEADSSLGMVSIANGLYWTNPVNCVAVYIPSRAAKGPYIWIGRVYTSGELSEEQRIYLSDIDASAFRGDDYPFVDEKLPAVDLYTTNISGIDDLVINISLPVKDDGNYNHMLQNGISVIYSYPHAPKGSMYHMEKAFEIPIGTNSKRMRFASACQADLNGNGVDELIVAGHLNEGGDIWKCGHMTAGTNMVQMVTWNEDKQAYQYVWSEPKKVAAIKDVFVGKEILEPAALTAGKYFSGDPKDYLFVEGVTFDMNLNYKKEDVQTEADYFKNGSFSEKNRIDLGGMRNKFVSRAVTGCFAHDRYGTQQTVVQSGAIEANRNGYIDYDITWLHGTGVPGDTSLTQTKSDVGYIDNRAQRDDGTFLTIADVNVDNDTMYFKYKGKQCGWSAPTPVMVLPATPHYGELLYKDGYDAGSVSFGISQSHTEGTSGDWNLGAGLNFGMEMTAGVKLAGESLQGGFGINYEVMAQYVGSVLNSNNVATGVSYNTAGNRTNVVCVASPLTSYSYDVWVPEYKVTDDMRAQYKKQTGEECPFAANTMQGGKFETFWINNVYDPQYSILPLDDYNAAAQKYGTADAPIRQIDIKEVYGDYAPGAPDTYPGAQADIPNIAQDSFNSKAAQSIGTTSDTTFSLAYDKTHEIDHGLNVNFSGQINGVLNASVSLFTAGTFSGHAGGSFAVGGGFTRLASDTKGTTVNATISKLPADGSAYAFTATPALWRTTAVSDKDYEPLYVFGFLTGGADTSPPTVPDMWVYDTRLEPATPNAQTSYITLCWDKDDVSRPAASYQVYQVAGNTTLPLGTATGNMFTVTGLTPGETYKFQLRAYEAGGANPSALGRPLQATAQPENPPKITQDLQNANAKVGNSATFTIGATPTSGGNLYYQWQKYTLGADSLLGSWQNLGDPVASNSYTFENVQAGDNNTKVRVIVFEDKLVGGVAPMAYSREAVLTVGAVNNSMQPILSMNTLSTTNGESTVGVGEDVSTYDLRPDLGFADPTDEYLVENKASYFLFVDSTGKTFLHMWGIDLGAQSISVDLDSFVSNGGLQEGRITVYWIYTGDPIKGATDEERIENLKKFLHGDGTALTTLALPGAAPLPNEAIGPEVTPTPEGSSTPETTPAPAEGTEGDALMQTTAIDAEQGAAEATPTETTEPPSTEPAAASSPGGSPDNESAPKNTILAQGEAAPLAGGSAILPTYAVGIINYHGVDEDSNSVEVGFNAGRGVNSPLNISRITRATPLFTLQPAEARGGKFLGWFADAGHTDDVDTLGPVPTGSLPAMLHAAYEDTVYNVTYHLDGGTNDPRNPSTFTVTSPSLPLRDPVKAGYKFMGWFLGPQMQNRVYSIAHGSMGDMELYAKWHLVNYNIYYTAGAGSLPAGNPDTYTVLDSVAPAPPAYPSGNGAWYTDYAYANAFGGLPAGNTGTLVLYGKAPSPGDPNPGSPGTPGGTPKTGDETDMTPFILLAIIAGAVVVVVLLYRKKRMKS